MNSELLNLSKHYDFELPKSQIAQFPLANRADAKLMVVNRASGHIEHHHVRDLSSILAAGDCLIQNDSKVVPAKLNGFRSTTGGRWTGLFIEQDEQGLWRILGKTRGKPGPGETIDLIDRNGRQACQLTLLTKLTGGSWIARSSIDGPAFETLETIGTIPLPHYIRGGQMVDDDVKNYQTVYAKKNGSIAAPTAGLHFTENLLRQLDLKGIRIERVTLHVGIGTFKPIANDDLNQHQMHGEFGSISSNAANAINHTRELGGRVIAVGTTSVRVLESAVVDSRMNAWQGTTNLFIKPPFQFKSIDGLMTNFHLPRSTLLVLVRTFGGDELIRMAYELAVKEKYRFFSYGDAMLIL